MDKAKFIEFASEIFGRRVTLNTGFGSYYYGAINIDTNGFLYNKKILFKGIEYEAIDGKDFALKRKMMPVVQGDFLAGWVKGGAIITSIRNPHLTMSEEHLKEYLSLFKDKVRPEEFPAQVYIEDADLYEYYEAIAKAQNQHLRKVIEVRDRNHTLLKLKKDLKIIKNYPLVKDAIVGYHSLRILTTNLPLVVDDYTLELGEMGIEIALTEGNIYIQNLTKRVKGFREGMHHPHVFPDGKACWGNYYNDIKELMNSRDFAGLVTVILSFLQTANPADEAGVFFYKWGDDEFIEEYERNFVRNDVDEYDEYDGDEGSED